LKERPAAISVPDQACWRGANAAENPIRASRGLSDASREGKHADACSHLPERRPPEL
jgi:hypothetical protein